MAAAFTHSLLLVSLTPPRRLAEWVATDQANWYLIAQVQGLFTREALVTAVAGSMLLLLSGFVTEMGDYGRYMSWDGCDDTGE